MPQHARDCFGIIQNYPFWLITLKAEAVIAKDLIPMWHQSCDFNSPLALITTVRIVAHLCVTRRERVPTSNTTKMRQFSERHVSRMTAVLTILRYKASATTLNDDVLGSTTTFEALLDRSRQRVL